MLVFTRCVSGACAVILAYFGITAVPKLAVALGALCVLALLAIGVGGYIEHRERESERRAREEDRQDRQLANRHVAEMHAKMLELTAMLPDKSGIPGGLRSLLSMQVEAPAQLPQPIAPIMLRSAGLTLAKGYRDFADEWSENYDDTLMQKFWDKYPFKQLADIKDRLENQPQLRFRTESAAERLPTTPDRIRKTANALEREALQVEPDVPL